MDTLCGRRLGAVECHLPAGHGGPHEGLWPLADGNYAEVMWTNEYEGVESQPWIANLAADYDSDDYGDLAWATYGDAPTAEEATLWRLS